MKFTWPISKIQIFIYYQIEQINKNNAIRLICYTETLKPSGTEPSERRGKSLLSEALGSKMNICSKIKLNRADSLGEVRQ